MFEESYVFFGSKLVHSQDISATILHELLAPLRLLILELVGPEEKTRQALGFAHPPTIGFLTNQLLGILGFWF